MPPSGRLFLFAAALAALLVAGSAAGLIAPKRFTGNFTPTPANLAEKTLRTR